MDGEQPSISQSKHCSYASTNGFSGHGKFKVTGLINPKDNEATEKKAEQLALDSSSGLETRSTAPPSHRCIWPPSTL